MMLYKKWFILMVFGVGLLGCGGDDGQVILRVAWMGTEHETYKKWKVAFEAEHPGVIVEMQFIPYDQGPTVYNTMIQGDNLPDLGYVFMGMIPEFAERGALESLDAYMTNEARQAWLEVPLRAAEYKDKLYGIPLSAANRTLYVRKDWVMAAGLEMPNTWEAVRDLVVGLNDPPNRYGFCIGAGRQKHLMQEQIAMMWGFGAHFFDATGKLTINSAEAVDYVSFLTDMHLKDRAMPPGILTLNANECYDEMSAGKVGMVFSGPWQYKQCQDSGIECVPLHIPQGKDRKMLLIVDVLAMFSTSKHKDLAYAFMEMTRRQENRTLIDVEVGGVPVTRDLGDHPYYQSPPIQVYLDQKNLLRLTPKHPEWTQIQDGWGEAIQMVLSGKSTPKQALDAVYERLLKDLIDSRLPR